MNITTKKTIIVIVTIAVVAAYSNKSQNATIDHLSERFPNLNKKIAKRAYRKIQNDALLGKTNFSNWSEAAFDDLFFLEYTMMLTNTNQ